ncbi:MAG: MBL fold metallo-hydrolase [Thermodesulfobacteriota bacterium]|nr:MBL fold metallo-hydrolase [Thermodesulfobacteriota bacterium]
MNREFPQITHLGAEHTVTGSCHLMQVNGLNIMVDCGIPQGRDHVIPIEKWPVKPRELDFLFLTHAHIDHIGRLPELVKRGFHGEIITTHPTKALIIPMLRDAMGFLSLSESRITALSQTINNLSWGFEYNQEFDLRKGIKFKLGCAGHILGSCFIRFTEKESGRSVLFSGDLGATDTPILPDPDKAEGADLLILESTYGDRLHEDRHQRVQRLGDALTRALSDRGKVFIPAFALGRTQELIYEIDRLFSDPEYEQVFPSLSKDHRPSVFIDSPLGLEITEIYSRLSEYWDKEAKEIYSHGDHPIDFARLYAVKNYKSHNGLIDMAGPAIIIAGSGMCTGGRILDHLAFGLNEGKNDIFFVGYQAAETLGRKIIKYGKRPNGYVYLDGKRIDIKAGIHTLTGYSAHADQKGLIQWVESMGKKPKRIKLVHGELEAQLTLSKALSHRGYSVVD